MTEVVSVPKKSAAKKKREKASTHKEVATRLHSKIVRHNAVCELSSRPLGVSSRVPGDCYGPLTCAHIVRRSWAATRTDLENGIPLCSSHHSYLDLHLYDLITYVDLTRGAGTYEALQAKADAGIAATGMSPLLFWRNERARLTAIAKERGVL